MKVRRYAAFAAGTSGGNPAGVVIDDQLPDVEDMQRIAAEVGYSETAFAARSGEGAFRVRYFAPESEVPFCGHATIALGAALAESVGPGRYDLVLNHAEISVTGAIDDEGMSAALQSPPTSSRPAEPALVAAALDLFGLDADDLDGRLPPGLVEAGARHLALALVSRERLSRMAYDLEQGRTLMREHGLVTISLVHVAGERRFDARNAFASGGVLEDPATGAAAAALAGYLRDLGWPHGGSIEIAQGDDMGMPSRITAEIPPTPGSSIRVSGRVRRI